MFIKYLMIAVSLVMLSNPGAGAEYCFEKAATTYNISPQILWAISKQESGHRATAINFNKDGSFDFCHMQINSKWKSTIGKERWQYLNDPCYCTMVGAWILSLCIQKYGYNWNAIGCYHSQTPVRRESYARQIYRTLAQQN
jgi:soluble lytic murein transglycosylase-like protein